MARRPTGQLYVVKTGGGGRSYGVRFRWKGKRHYRTLGHSNEGMTKRQAERAAEGLIARLVAGAWDPEQDRRRELAIERERSLTFDEFAREWFERRKITGGRAGEGLTLAGENDLAWRLDHLRAWFGGFNLADITVEEVERYMTAKRAAGGLSVTSVNKTLSTLRAILKTAVRYGHIDHNPAEDCRLPAVKFRGSHLDRVVEIVALLDAAGELDGKGRLRVGHGRALLATLTLAGLRIDEALSLRWRDVDLARGTIRVRSSKTEAGERTVYVLPPLRDELLELAARRKGDRDALVFGTSAGGKDSPSNVRRRLLARAVELANAQLVDRGFNELPERLTPHSLRRTFASILVACGENPTYVMGQLGHEKADFTLSVYSRQMQRRDGELERLRAFVKGRSLTLADLDRERAKGQGEGNRAEKLESAKMVAA